MARLSERVTLSARGSGARKWILSNWGNVLPRKWPGRIISRQRRRRRRRAQVTEASSLKASLSLSFSPFPLLFPSFTESAVSFIRRELRSCRIPTNKFPRRGRRLCFLLAFCSALYSCDLYLPSPVRFSPLAALRANFCPPLQDSRR